MANYEQFQKLFYTFANFSKLLIFFKQFKLFHMIQMFSNFSYILTNVNFVYLCLPLFTFVYLCLPLCTFVYLCSTDASIHKLCACFYIHVFETAFFTLIRNPVLIIQLILVYHVVCLLQCEIQQQLLYHGERKLQSRFNPLSTVWTLLKSLHENLNNIYM